MPLSKIIFALLHRLCFLSLFFFSAVSFAEDDLIPANLLSALNDAGFNTQQESPFKVSEQLNENTLNISIDLKAGAYIYKDSLNLSVSDEGEAYFSKLPQAMEHTDFQGSHEVFFNKADLEALIVKSNEGALLTFSFQGCDGEGICYPPQTISITLPKIDPVLGNSPNEYINENHQTTEDKLSGTLSSNFIFGLLLCFILGIGLDLTPCVLPMLPIFSTMIAGQSAKESQKNIAANCAYLFGLCLTYTLVGLLFSYAGSSLHRILQSPYMAYTLAAFLFLCALSCAGFFTLSMPQSLSTGLQSKLATLNMTGTMSAFIFGLVSALITTPCTSAPLAGALLFILKEGDLLKGTLAFFCIGLGMGMPLFLIGVLGSKFILKARTFSAVIYKLMAIPLILAALYIVDGYLGSYKHYLKNAVFILLCAYCAFVLYKNTAPSLLKRIGISLCAAITVICLSSGYKYEESPTLPFTEIKSLNELNITSNKALLVVGAKWCSNCRQMEKDIFINDEFKKLTYDMQLFHFDITDSASPQVQEFMKHFSLIGVPYTALLNQKGEVIVDAIGYLDFNEFKKRFLN
ncbi:protein-disulfide reductase DsbD domain-containing protein [uncultured Succinatimonas sp.]|uniref:cytochrome c biogenesis protein CcdA n=1 Tax=uncultured Succinatimonas sp. TaxID=1262973 RepID=UPI0025CF4243|nr:protein-disulfide reductase DsbD domain-containing protein [uncultured Succinatimonas sp.]